MTRIRPCGNPNCCTSTAISEHLTFGSGELDEYGFWEKPCWVCARAYEKEHPKEEAWPFNEETLRRMAIKNEICKWESLDKITRPGIIEDVLDIKINPNYYPDGE